MSFSRTMELVKASAMRSTSKMPLDTRQRDLGLRHADVEIDTSSQCS